MAARLDSVCKYICEASDWTISNLKLQKILFMAQMVFMGQNEGRRLADADFEAWDYGPVEPTLYRKVRRFGSAPIEDVFYQARPFKMDDPRKILLDDVCGELLALKPGELVDMTHWPEGAWAKNYVPGIRSIRIPDADIVAEYNRRAEEES